MLTKMAANLLSQGLKEQSNLNSAINSIALYPVRVFACFIFSPILLLKLALCVKNPVRRAIAIMGLMLSTLLAYLAATLLGTWVGSFMVASHIGIISGLGFFFGSLLSIYISVAFCVVVFNSVSFIFLKMSAQEVIDHLDEISK